MSQDWVRPVAEYMVLGLERTVILAGLTVLAGSILGTVIGISSLIRHPLVRIPVRVYIEVWRGLPSLLTLFFAFFGLPKLGIDVPTFLAAVIGLTLWSSANIAEIVRGAVQSIPVQQHEAAAALGFNPARAMLFVVLPQALRRLLPPLVGQLTVVIQSTTLASIVGVLEVLESANRSIGRLTTLEGDPHSIPILAAVMGAFFVICFPISRLASWLQRRLVV